jgi:hypothetical protein
MTKCIQRSANMKIKLSAEQTQRFYEMMWPELLRIRNEEKKLPQKK